MAIISRYGPVAGCPCRGLTTFRGACLVSASGAPGVDSGSSTAAPRLPDFGNPEAVTGYDGAARAPCKNGANRLEEMRCVLAWHYAF
jgi:hypothetical protein